MARGAEGHRRAEAVVTHGRHHLHSRKTSRSMQRPSAESELDSFAIFHYHLKERGYKRIHAKLVTTYERKA